MQTDVVTSRSESSASAIPPATGSSRINVGQTERIISVVAGALLGVLGVRSLNKFSGKAMTVTGAMLLKRGATGYCEVNSLINRDSSTSSKKAKALEVMGVFTVNKPREEVYRFWRNFQNLPRFMKHLESVKVIDERRSEWTAVIPGNVGTISWEAIIQEERENSYISWCSLPGSTVDNAGEVRFSDAPGNRGTEVHAQISYRLPVGDVGSLAGKLFNPLVEQFMKEDLRKFKQLMEAGEIPTIEGQPSARTKDIGKANALKEERVPQNLSNTTYESTMLERH